VKKDSSALQGAVFDAGKIDVAAEEQETLITDMLTDTTNIIKATKITPKRICFYTATSWKWQVYLKILDQTVAGEAKINTLMKEFAADKDLKPHMKTIAGMVPRIIKSLMKVSSERKANMQKIKAVDEQAILAGTMGFLGQRFNAEVSVYSEDMKERFDPKNRAAMAMPYQPAIYIE
jgi:hypothetical protein